MAEKKRTAAQETTAAPDSSAYTVDEFAENASCLNASPDIIRAAFAEKKLDSATLEDAKKIVKEFKERKV